MGLSTVFIDYSMTFAMMTVEAEIYMRIYQYASEDFRATSDCNIAHNLVTTWQTASESAVSTYATQMATHIHPTPEGPSGPPTPPGIYAQVPPSLPPVNKTGSIDNVIGNIKILMSVMTYLDLSFTSVNVAIPNFRRGLQIPIAYGPFSLALKIQ
ncbi:MAG: hypothetical protein DRQ78_04820 [Epsilonproteobacteria bacterium]|nr:MAG: hypothetical protein DRQ78_04820 [Campylobacterota bacterium]